MDIETMETVEAETDLDAFDAGWDDDNGFETSEGEGANDPQPEDQRPENEAPHEEESTPSNNANEEVIEDSYELKYMDQTRKVGRNEVTVLAQKGMDYDRIRTERDSFKAEAEQLRESQRLFGKYDAFMKELAKDGDVDEAMDTVRARMLVQRAEAEGRHMDYDAALERVKFDRERAEFEAMKAGKQTAEKEPEPEVKDTESARAQDRFLEFAQNFPDVKPEDIPKEVWDEFEKGQPLSDAYMKYENRQLKEKIKTLELNQKNRERSLGSSASSGAGKQRDPFDIGWDIE